MEISREEEEEEEEEEEKIGISISPLPIGRELLLFSCLSTKHGTISRNPFPFPRTQFVVIIVYSL